eukprot:COSAG01_NODE_697_length_14188_cov_41.810348_16_plen_49_part_00
MKLGRGRDASEGSVFISAVLQLYYKMYMHVRFKASHNHKLCVERFHYR